MGQIVAVDDGRAAALAAAPHGQEPAGLAHRPPDGFELGARPLGAALQVAGGQGDRIDGAGAGAADAVDLERPAFQEAVEHAPGEGAVGAAALQREIDRPRPGGALLQDVENASETISAGLGHGPYVGPWILRCNKSFPLTLNQILRTALRRNEACPPLPWPDRCVSMG